MASLPSPIVEKVGACIIRPNREGLFELLLFSHADMPEVPVQIPGGSVEPGGETIEEALHREIMEEAGLVNLKVVRKLGISDWFWEQQQIWVKRHVFLLEAPSETPDSWIHAVSGSGSDAQLRFAYHWLRPMPEFKLCGDLHLFLNWEHVPELYSSSPEHR